MALLVKILLLLHLISLFDENQMMMRMNLKKKMVALWSPHGLQLLLPFA